jgi:hypothetical protein
VLHFEHPKLKRKGGAKFVILVSKEFSNDKTKKLCRCCMTINRYFPNIHRLQNMYHGYVEILANDYKFLRCDSYINCIGIVPIPIKEIPDNYKPIDEKISNKTLKEILVILKSLDQVDQDLKERVISEVESVINENNKLIF